MASLLDECRTAIYTALVAVSPDIAGGRIASHIDDYETFPYVLLGAGTHIMEDTTCHAAGQNIFDIHVFDREYRGVKRCQLIVDQIYNTLHNIDLNVAGHVTTCYIENVRSYVEDDGLTYHGVLQCVIYHSED